MMKKTVQSTIRPQAVEIDEYSVWVADDIREITVKDEEGQEHVEYEYELTQLTKDEYILKLHEDQQQTKTENELAMADLAMTMFGGGF